MQDTKPYKYTSFAVLLCIILAILIWAVAFNVLVIALSSVEHSELKTISIYGVAAALSVYAAIGIAAKTFKKANVVFVSKFLFITVTVMQIFRFALSQGGFNLMPINIMGSFVVIIVTYFVSRAAVRNLTS